MVNYRYNYILIDSVNFAYKLFKHKEETPIQVGKKLVYKNSICKFINSIEELKDHYLLDNGHIYLLFDNYFSKADLRSMFMYTDRHKLDESYKATRNKDNKEFYNSLNFLRYYYLIGPSNYHTVRIDNLEADDLVYPILTKLNIFNDESKKVLLVSSDLDWTRYLSTNVDWLPTLNDEPETVYDLSNKLGFEVNQKNIILYKVLFGDKSDNIDPVTTMTDEHFNEFLELIKIVDTPDDLIYMSRDSEKCKKYTLLQDIQKPDRKQQRKYDTKEALVKINTQLVSAIPCSIDIINSNLTSGRNNVSLYKTVREAIGLENNQEFTFGNIKRNRV